MLPKQYIMKKHCLLPLVFVLMYTSLSGQGLQIYYDVQSDSIYYMRDGERVQKPKARYGELVSLHIKNYNNYLYKAVVEEQQQEDKMSAPIAGGLSNLLPSGGLSGGGSPFNLLMGAMGGGGDFPFGDFAGVEGGDGLVSAQSKAFEGLYSQFYSLVNNIKSSESKLQAAGKDMERLLQAQQIKAFAAEEVKNLQKNPNMPPTEIKRLSLEYLETVLGPEATGGLSLGKIIEKTGAQSELQGKLETYRNETEKLEGYYGAVAFIRDSLQGLSLGTATFEELQKSVADYASDGNERLAYYHQMVGKAEEALPKAENFSVQGLIKMRYAMEELKANTFSHTFRATARGDMLGLKVVLEPIDSAGVPGLSTRKLSTLEIPVKGGFKLNASVGVSFSSFFDQPRNYFLRDTLISSEDKDQFTPVVTSFLHFYNQSAGNTSFGGAFGIGLALGGQDGGQNINFFLGPSLMLGRGQRLALTAGLMGGKVERLGEGYEVGDTFISEADNVPTRSVYELGYFLGLSFNLMSN